jgi:phosphoglucosamine mutase
VAQSSGKPCIFGTDGVRDRAGEGFLAPAELERILGATVAALENGGAAGALSGAARRRVLVGRDTRASGSAIERSIAGAFSGAGYEVGLLGVIPTPGVAFLSSALSDVALGIVISASHNPAAYNGIKFVAPDGGKVARRFEEAVSEIYWERAAGARSGAAPRSCGRVVEMKREAGLYVERLVSRAGDPARLRGRVIVLDAAHGAAWEVGRRVFESLGARVISIGDAPDGLNINEGCGALHPQVLAARVREEGADCGFAFDGDGDRMIPVTGGGRILDGDHVLAVAGRAFDRLGRLPRRTVVATVMSNIGLEKSLAAAGLRLLRTPVGDRHVYDAMVEDGHPIGGEQSGHIIFLDDARTGDGILAAIRLLDCVAALGFESLEEAAGIMRQYPQLLINYKVARREPLDTLPAVQQAVAAAERALGGDGRIVLRYSGTEPLLRVMVEGPDETVVRRLAEGIGRTAVAALES